MKKLFSLLFAVALLCSLCIFPVSAVDVSDSATTEQETIAVPLAARIAVSYNKTITVNYASQSSIPTYYTYTEYNSEYNAWFTGNLALKSVTKMSKTKWVATFSGVMHGTI